MVGRSAQTTCRFRVTAFADLGLARVGVHLDLEDGLVGGREHRAGLLVDLDIPEVDK